MILSSLYSFSQVLRIFCRVYRMNVRQLRDTIKVYKVSFLSFIYFFCQNRMWLDMRRVFMAFSYFFWFHTLFCYTSLLIEWTKKFSSYLFKTLVYLCVMFIVLNSTHSVSSFIIMNENFPIMFITRYDYGHTKSHRFYSGLSDHTSKINTWVFQYLWSHLLNCLFSFQMRSFYGFPNCLRGRKIIWNVRRLCLNN